MENELFPLILVFLGVIFGLIGFVSLKRSKAASTWPTIMGTILSSSVIRHDDTDSDGSSSVTYEPDVDYQYSVMGQVYTGKKIAFGANRFNYKKAVEIASRYPVGANVTVHYNPEKVADARLEITAVGSKAFLIIGSLLVAGGLIWFVVSLII